MTFNFVCLIIYLSFLLRIRFIFSFWIIVSDPDPVFRQDPGPGHLKYQIECKKYLWFSIFSTSSHIKFRLILSKSEIDPPFTEYVWKTHAFTVHKLGTYLRQYPWKTCTFPSPLGDIFIHRFKLLKVGRFRVVGVRGIGVLIGQKVPPSNFSQDGSCLLLESVFDHSVNTLGHFQF